MRTWAKELQEHTHDYVRRGGKQNRKKQVSLIIDFLQFTDAQEDLRSLHRLGKRHVINFWKSHRELSDKMAYDYWLGMCKLWEWIDKPDKPPKPNNVSKQNDHIVQERKPIPGISTAIKTARESKNITVQQLANLTGCEAMLIEDIESGNTIIMLSDIQILFKTLNIKFTY